MGAEALAHVLRPLAATFGASDELLVGLGSADDAAVYRLNDEQAIVATTDFFPPVVDDPYTFGAIAAANALSDIYAMGGTPLFCLNLVGFPDDLDPDILSEILRGGADKVREAGAVTAGGHSVTDAEPKYGLAAIGVVHPARVWTKAGIQPGDVLLLTKPIGTGVVTTAAKNERADPADLEAAIQSMRRLNAQAAHVLRQVGAELHACTDVTGFGLLGHALEMAEQSGVTLRFTANDVPELPGARRYAEAGDVPGGTERNLSAIAGKVRWEPGVNEIMRLLLADPQTSGGLLAAVAPGASGRVQERLREAGVDAWAVGSAVDPAEAGTGLIVEAGDERKDAR